ncbi:MAG TPA: hypothetical protein VEI97_03300, partial [bacterium]|nr:hypothetical protein [bacterium]
MRSSLLPRRPSALLAVALGWLLLAGLAFGQGNPPADPGAGEGDPEAIAGEVHQESQPQTAPQTDKGKVSAGAITVEVEVPLGAAKVEGISPIVVTLENAGPDFRGQLVVSTTTWVPTTQYFQPVELPSGATKRFQFTCFEKTPPAFEVILLEADGEVVQRQEVAPEPLSGSDVTLLQVGGHPSDFSALQGEAKEIRLGIEDIVSPAQVAASETLSAKKFQEPVIPYVHFKRVEPEALPSNLIGIEWVNTILLDLGTYQQMDQ